MPLKYIFLQININSCYFKEFLDCVFDLCLDKPEFFITLIAKYFAENCDVVVFMGEFFDPVDDGARPFDDEVFQAVFLIEVRIHVLLHCLSWQLGFCVLLVELGLRLVDLEDDIFDLLHCERS